MRCWIIKGIFLFVALMIVGCGTATPTIPPTKLLNPGIVLHPTKTATIIPSPSATVPTRIPQPSPTPTSTPEPLSTIEPEFWATMGVAPDMLVALQTGNPNQSLGDIAVMSIDGTQYQTLTAYGYNRDPRLSPDRQRIAYRSVPASIVSSPDRDKRLREGNYNLWVITTDGAQAWKLTDSEQPRSIPDWSADSQKVLFSEGTEGALVEIDVDTQARREIARGAYSPRYRSGGGVGYITKGGGLAWIDEAGTSHMLVPTATLPVSTTVSEFAWLPDGQRIVYILLDQSGAQRYTWAVKSSVEVVKSEDGIGTHLIGPVDNVRLSSIQISPDGHLLGAKGGSYGDACAPGSHSNFWLIAPDLKSVEYAPIESFDGSLSRLFSGMGNMYPTSDSTWISDHLALGHFAMTCDMAALPAFGWYLIDFEGKRMLQITRD